MEIKDTYSTIAQATEEIVFKEKSSKFFGYAFPVESEEDVKPILDHLHKLHPQAAHYCYAYQIGTEQLKYRANDDGEPNNTAGLPIYGQIQSFGLTNIVVVVVRFFGGTKLGVGGLITAYKTTAQLVLAQAQIIEKTIDLHFLISFEYTNMNKVMRLIKEKKLDIVSQTMELKDDSEQALVEIELKTRKKNAERVFGIFDNFFGIEFKIL